jgi:hypothetical protein
MDVFSDPFGRIWARKGKFYLCVRQDGIWPDDYQPICGRVVVISQEDGSSKLGEITWHDDKKIRVKLDDGSEIEFSLDEYISLDERYSFDFYWPFFEEDPDDGDASDDNSDEDNSDEENFENEGQV